MLKSWRALTLWKRVFIGLFLGILIGLGLHYGLGPEKGGMIAEKWIYPFGEAFVNLIRMLVVPLIATTLVSGVITMGDPKRLGKLGARTLGLYMLTTFFAVWLGLGIGTLIQPGAGMGDLISSASGSIDAVNTRLEAGKNAGGIVDRLLAIIPTNPINALADGDVLGIIFFSVLIGVGILLVGDKGKPLAAFFDSASEVVMKVTMMVMNLAPYGVMALMAWVMGTKGLGILSSMGKLAFALYLACFLQIILVYGGLIVKTILRLPLARFFYGIADALGVAYSTASSNATLPVTISCAEHNLGVDKSIAGSVLPMGATINMDGTAIYLGIVALFAAQALGIELTMTQYVMVALTATLTSIGAAGIPSAGLLLAAVVLSVIGINEAQATVIIAFIFPFDRLLDMMRTATNVTGDVAVACTVAKWEGQLDEEVFRRKSVV
ncbi:MAG: dicarboxylate/amino acid:cation symporter [Robiginitomaculum sp.]|nr:MAG: dicarboxylate/amino acid:cation symporter [Robiginitomaculum sp.]